MSEQYRVRDLRLKQVRCGKTGKWSKNRYWYRRVRSGGKDTEIYLGRAEAFSPMPERAHCLACGAGFIKNRRWHSYCSKRCADKARYMRLKLIKENY